MIKIVWCCAALLSLIYSIFSGIKTADDLVNCMRNKRCEAVPEAGYGYHKQPQCPKRECPQCNDTHTWQHFGNIQKMDEDDK